MGGPGSGPKKGSARVSKYGTGQKTSKLPKRDQYKILAGTMMQRGKK